MPATPQTQRNEVLAPNNMPLYHFFPHLKDIGGAFSSSECLALFIFPFLVLLDFSTKGRSIY